MVQSLLVIQDVPTDEQSDRCTRMDCILDEVHMCTGSWTGLHSLAHCLYGTATRTADS